MKIKSLFYAFITSIVLTVVGTSTANAQAPKEVYVVPNGTVWHSTNQCSYLSRSRVINKVSYESVKHMKPCSRCGHATSSSTQSTVSTHTATNSNNSDETYNGHKVHTGPKGGKYYINSSGNKVYIKR